MSSVRELKRKGYPPNDPGLQPNLPPHVIRVIPDVTTGNKISHIVVEELTEFTTQPWPHSHGQVEVQYAHDPTHTHSCHGSNMYVHPSTYEQWTQEPHRDWPQPPTPGKQFDTHPREIRSPVLDPTIKMDSTVRNLHEW